VKTYPYPFEGEEAEEYEMQRFSLMCKRKDLHVPELLKAVCHEDFPMKPGFGRDAIDYPNVFFVNITKDIIFFIYDDHGCEVIALDADPIYQPYQKYQDWLDEMDRKRIEALQL